MIYSTVSCYYNHRKEWIIITSKLSRVTSSQINTAGSSNDISPVQPTKEIERSAHPIHLLISPKASSETSKSCYIRILKLITTFLVTWPLSGVFRYSSGTPPVDGVWMYHAGILTSVRYMRAPCSILISVKGMQKLVFWVLYSAWSLLDGIDGVAQ